MVLLYQRGQQPPSGCGNNKPDETCTRYLITYILQGVTKNEQVVAVKKLKPCFVDLDNKHFRNEFHTLVNLDHPNIVKVLGYCYEAEKKNIMLDGIKVFVDEIHTALCFEYMHNRSLQKHLSGTAACSIFSMPTNKSLVYCI